MIALIDPFVNDRKARQIEVDRWKRREALGALYREWSDAQSVAARRYLPRLSDFWRLPCVFEVCSELDGDPISQAVWTDLEPVVIKEIKDWQVLVEIGFVRLVLQAEQGNGVEPVKPEAKSDEVGSQGGIKMNIDDDDVPAQKTKSSPEIEARLHAVADDEDARRSILQRADVYFVCCVEGSGHYDRLRRDDGTPTHHPFPGILHHRCNAGPNSVPFAFARDAVTQQGHQLLKPVEAMQPYQLTSAASKEWPLLRETQIRLSDMRLVQDLVQRLGKDVAAVTRGELDDLGAIWDCRLPEGGTTYYTSCEVDRHRNYSWSALLAHVFCNHREHLGRANKILTWLDPKEPTIIRDLRSVRPSFADVPDMARCSLCPGRPSTLSFTQAWKHLREW